MHQWEHHACQDLLLRQVNQTLQQEKKQLLQFKLHSSFYSNHLSSAAQNFTKVSPLGLKCSKLVFARKHVFTEEKTVLPFSRTGRVKKPYFIIKTNNFCQNCSSTESAGCTKLTFARQIGCVPAEHPGSDLTKHLSICLTLSL